MNEKLWEQFDLSQLNRLTGTIMNGNHTSFTDVTLELLEGDFKGAGALLKEAFQNALLPGVQESKELFLGLLLLGILAMLLQYVSGLVKNKQVADMTHYFVYLFSVLLIMRSFELMLSICEQVITDSREFMALLLPAYSLSISLSSGAVSAAVNYQLVLFLLLGINLILCRLLLPMAQCYIFLTIMNGLDERHRFREFMKLTDKGITLAVKLCLTATLSLSAVQNLVSARVDGVQKTLVQKTVSLIPGIGDMSESVTQVFLGSAELIKNSIGAAAMLFLLLVVLVPIWRIFCMTVSLKLSAACISLMGQNSLSDTISKAGDGGIQVMKIGLCALLLFYIVIAVTMLICRGGV